MADKDDDKDKGGDGDKDEPGFTEAQAAYIAKVIRKERRRHEAELADLRDELKPEPGGEKGGRPFDQEKDGDSETQQLRRELAEERAAREHDKLMEAARKAALAADVDPKRVDRFLRLADLDGIKSTDRERIAEAIADAVEDAPEFVATTTGKKDDDPGDTKKDEPKGGKAGDDGRSKDSTLDDTTRRPASAEADVEPGIARMRAAYAASESS